MKIKILTKFSEKLLGLAFKNRVEPVYFETRWGIHTFFVKVPIDVVICDEDFIIKNVKLNLQPSQILIWNPRYKRVFELPSGNKRTSELKVGNYLKPIEDKNYYYF